MRLVLFISLVLLLTGFETVASDESLDVDFNQSTCYSAEAATLSSVLFSFDHQEPSTKVKITHPQTKESIFFRVYAPQNPQNHHWVLIFAGIATGVDDIHGIKAVNLMRKVGMDNGMIIIPSVFREDFARSFSQKGVVGNIPQDVQGLLQAMNLLKANFLDPNFHIEKLTYFGFSLGALSAAHLATQLEQTPNFFRPNKVILMNSPINLLGSLQNIDRLNEAGAGIVSTGQVAVNYLNHLKKYPNFENMETLLCGLAPASSQAISKVITDSLKFNLDELFLYGQQRNPTGALDNRYRHYLSSSRERRRIQRLRNRRSANKLTFESYVKNTVLPTSGERDLKILNNKVSVTALAQKIKNNSDYYLIHTQDDFLQSNQKELREYAALFLEENKWVKKKGGHLGLLNSLELGKTLKRFIDN